MTSEQLVELSDLHVRRGGHPVLDGCTGTFGAGITLLVGANGAGKTTLLRTIAGLSPAPPGAVRVGGSAVVAGGLDRRQGALLGYLPQQPALPARLTVREAVSYARWLHRCAPTQDDDLIDALDLGTVADRRLGELSGGMNRLAMVAVAVAHDPAVLLLDEATAGVDVEHRAAFRSFLVRRRSRTIVLASHLGDDVEHLADRVVALAGGRFAYDGDVAGLEALGAPVRRDHESGIEAALRLLATRTRQEDRP